MRKRLNFARLIAVLVMAVVTAWGGGHFTVLPPTTLHRTAEGLRFMNDITRTLADVLKSAPSATSHSGLSSLLFNSSGEPMKTGTMIVGGGLPSQDLNDIMDWRIALINNLNGTIQNAPATANGMILISLGDYHIVLRAGGGGIIYFRCCPTSGWTAWKKVAMSEV